MFDQIDKEEDGVIYIKDVLFYLKALSNDLDQNKEVQLLRPEGNISFYLSFNSG